MALFRVAVRDMAPLSGVRAVNVLGQSLASGPWLWGATVMGLGVILQLLALGRLTVPEAEPAFVAGLVLLLVITRAFFGERLSPVEWGCLLLMAAGSVLVARALAASHMADPPPVSGPVLYAVSGISLVVPVLLFVAGDLRPSGLHARRLTGVAYGITSGVLIGTAEMALVAIVRVDPDVLLRTPYPYLFFIAVGLGIGQLQIALQRCRMVVVVSIATIVAKTQLTLSFALVLAAGPRFEHLTPPVLGLGLAMLGTALVLVPRHDLDQRDDLGLRDDLAPRGYAAPETGPFASPGR
jgi:multidrug transporter EmrE-like cation transporter